MKKISLIIVTYNSSNLIEDCLDSVFKFNDIGDGLEVIIVDNASKDQEQLFQLISDKYGNKVLLIDGKCNGGYGKGNNIGVSHSTGDILIVMNPDIRLTMPTFKTIIDVFSDENVGMIGVNFIDGSNPFYYKPEYLYVFNELTLKYSIKRRKFNPQKMYMSGSLLGFTRRAYIECGGFDENIFLYLEEPDITNRIQKHGHDVKWCSDIYVHHLPHSIIFNSFTYSTLLESLKYYANKYNIDIKKNIRTRIRYYKIKQLVSRALNKKNKVTFFNEIINFYVNELVKIQ